MTEIAVCLGLAVLFVIGVFAVLIMVGAAQARETAAREIAARKEEDWSR